MTIVRIATSRIALGGLLLGLTGCGYYTITFEVADVINTDASRPADDLTSERMSVEIVCLTKADSKDHPELASGAMRAHDWFAARDGDERGTRHIDRSRIYALRDGAAADRRDTLVGKALISGNKLSKDSSRRTSVKVRHPEALAGESRVLIYGRFHDGSAVAKTEPLVIEPPAWKNELLIHVGRTSMEWTNKP